MEKDGILIIEIFSSDEEDDEIPIMKNTVNSAMKDENKKTKNKTNTDDDDDACLILDFNPFESINKLSINDVNEETQDLIVIAEIGQVACRDYPHSRHLCVKFPFNNTPHISYCQQCYCYVCDSSAPCVFWSTHCDAAENDPNWELHRNVGRAIRTAVRTVCKTG